jgi:hypothetical protein
MSVILFLYQSFHGLPAISCCASPIRCCVSISFYVSNCTFLSIILYILSVIFTEFFFLCVLLVYYLDNLLSNVPILASTSHCQFFISGVIDRISNLDREVSRDG